MGWRGPSWWPVIHKKQSLHMAISVDEEPSKAMPCLSCRLTVWHTSFNGYQVSPATVNEPDNRSCHPKVIIEWHPENAGVVGSDKGRNVTLVMSSKKGSSLWKSTNQHRGRNHIAPTRPSVGSTQIVVGEPQKLCFWSPCQPSLVTSICPRWQSVTLDVW